MKGAREGAVFLHCLPAHRGEEVAAEVIDGSQSVVWQQAGNRMHAVRALFAELVGGARVAQPTEGEAQPEATRGRDR